MSSRRKKTTTKTIAKATVAPVVNLYQQLVVRQLQRMIQLEGFSGMLLIASAFIAIIWANSPWGEVYQHLWHIPVRFAFGELSLNNSLSHWINDGLMVVFFFVVGLEIKREILKGELSSFRKAVLPIIAAAGGMIVPAIIYATFNHGKEGSNGWGIPMATDIAFALGILILAGRNVPVALKVFLAALAIVDDLGAVLVIAIFYTKELSFDYLMNGLMLYALMMVYNIAGVRSTLLYTVMGFVLWFFFLQSGVHATIAGVLMAFAIPAGRKLDHPFYLKSMRQLLDTFAETFNIKSENKEEKQSGEQTRMFLLDESYLLLRETYSPLERLEHGLQKWNIYLILPIFALANAGIVLSEMELSSLGSPVFLGVALGLFLGKQLGIFGFCWLAVKLKIASLPDQVNWKMIYGASVLGGIGFTMSLFITDLSLDTKDYLQPIAKLGVLTSTIVACLFGFWYMRRVTRLVPMPVITSEEV